MLARTKVATRFASFARAFSSAAETAAADAVAATTSRAPAPAPSVNAINSTKAPAAVGPYSHSVVSTYPSTAYVSGQLPLDPVTGEMVGTDAATQAVKCLENLDAILYRVNARRDTVVKTTVLLTDLADFASVNKVYAEFFGDHAPARVCYQVSALPKGALVEIDAIAATMGPRRRRTSSPKSKKSAATDVPVVAAAESN